MYKISVFVTGRGSNLKAIYNQISVSMPNVEIHSVISDKSDCPALSFASENGIKTFNVSNSQKEGFISYSSLAETLLKDEVNLIVLAGFLKKIPEDFIEKFENKIINIHPALLPSFGGKGMYGINVHKAVFESGVHYSGPTIHFVNKNYDEGKIIIQKAINISKANSPEEIAAMVLEEEHKLLPHVVKLFSEEKIKIENNRVIIRN